MRATPTWWRARSRSIRSSSAARTCCKNGRPQATGTILKDAALEPVLEHVADRLHWGEKFDRGNGAIKRGRGIAFALKACVSPTTSVAIVNVGADGSPTLYISTVDMGQGSDTGMAQIVGEVLNVPAESVRVVARDTDITPYDMGTLGSRSMFHMGHAVRLAAEDARSKIDALRREVGEPEGSNTPVSGLFIKKYGMKAGNIVGSGSYKPDYVAPDHDTGASTEITPFWMVAGTGAEVEVDTETGRVRVLKLVNAVDCGTLVNPRIVETQISGAAMMQLGFTLFEKIHLDNGQITNASLADYKIPGIADVPPVMINEAIDAYPEQRAVRRQRRRRILDHAAVAGDRQRARRRGRRAADRAAAHARGGVPRAAREGRPTARRGVRGHSPAGAALPIGRAGLSLSFAPPVTYPPLHKKAAGGKRWPTPPKFKSRISWTSTGSARSRSSSSPGRC